MACALRSAMPNLVYLDLQNNNLGSQGSTLLSPVLRKLPLERLILNDCNLPGDLASLFGDLGKDDFNKLEALYLRGNKITNKGCATISEAVCRGMLPALITVELVYEDGEGQVTNDSDPAARQAVYDAIQASHKM